MIAIAFFFLSVGLPVAVWSDTPTLTPAPETQALASPRDRALRNALRRPLFPMAADLQVPVGWSRVERLRRHQEIVVQPVQGAAVSGRLVAVDVAGLVLDVAGDTTPRTIGRDDIVTVSARGAPRGSKVGAIVGGSAGAFVGFVLALHLAYKDCGGSCGDERALIGVSLAGAPVAGAWLGFRGFARPGPMELVYRRTLP